MAAFSRYYNSAQQTPTHWSFQVGHAQHGQQYGDAGKTLVDRFAFSAYEPTEIDTSQPISLVLFEKLKVNAWFSEMIVEARWERWDSQRTVGDTQ